MLWIFAIENFFPLQIRYFNNVKEALLLNEREGSRLVFWFSFCIYTCFATDSKSGQNRALQMGKCGLCSSFSVVYFPVVGSSDFTFFPRKLHEFLSWVANVVGIGVTDMWSWEGFRKDPCLHFITWNLAILLYSFSSNLKKKKSFDSRPSFCGKCASWLPARPSWVCPAAGCPLPLVRRARPATFQEAAWQPF